MAQYDDDANDAACLICDSPEWWDCGHLIASIDQDYAECQGGVLYDDDRFQQLFLRLFLAQIAADPKRKFAHPIVDEVWQDWKSQNTGPLEDRNCDPYILLRLLTEAFEQNGASWSRHIIEGGPGATQQFINIFAEKPDDVVEATYSEFKRKLAVD